MWSYSENIWPKAQRIWPNARAFDEFRSHFVTVLGLTKCAARLVKFALVWPNTRAIYQTLRIWSNATRLTNWSNALRDYPNTQIGQMRLTPLIKISYVCYTLCC